MFNNIGALTKNTFYICTKLIKITMTWTAFWNGIAAIFELMFKMIKVLCQVPNILVWILLGCLLIFWTLQLVKHKGEAKRDGTYL